MMMVVVEVLVGVFCWYACIGLGFDLLFVAFFFQSLVCVCR